MLLFASATRAQGDDAAGAQALFDAAVAMMEQGRYTEACPKLEESQRLDPGIGTLFHLANCYERTGRTASAWAAFKGVASQARAAGHSDRESAARARAARLEGRLARLVVVVDGMRQVEGLEILRDGRVVGRAQWGESVPLDQGTHRMEARAPGRIASTWSVEVADGHTTRVEVPALQVGEGPATPLAAPSQSEPARQHSSGAPDGDARPAAGEEASTLSGWTVGLGIGGIVALGVGGVFTGLAVAANEESEKWCPDGCSPRGVELRNTAMTNGNVATVAFVVGSAALVGALATWLWLDGDAGSTAGGRGGDLRAGFVLHERECSIALEGTF